MKLLPAFIVPILASAALQAHALASITIVPAAPRYMEPVHARVTPPDSSHHLQHLKARMQGNTITIVTASVIDLPSRQPIPMDVLLGQLPAGTYNVVGPFGTSATFTVADGPTYDASRGFPTSDYTGLWYDGSEPGWGLSFAQGAADAAFAVWFVYDDQRRPTWYTLQPGSWSRNSYRGPIFRHTGPPLGASFDASTVTETAAGEGEIFFSAYDRGELVFTVGGVTHRKSLVRQPLE